MRLIFLFVLNLYALDISTILNKFQSSPTYKKIILSLKEKKTQKDEITSLLYPKIEAFYNYTHYNDIFSIKPISPLEATQIIKNNDPITFSQNVHKIGINFSMPIFVKEIYQKKLAINHLIKANEIVTKLNIIELQAKIISLISNLNYLFEYKNAISKELNSLLTTLKATEIGVKNKRIPEYYLLKLKNKINFLKITLNRIDSEIYNLQNSLFSLVKLKINQKIKLSSKNIKKNDSLIIASLKEKVKFTKQNLFANRAKKYPKLYLNANLTRAFFKPQNKDHLSATNIASISLNLKYDLFDKKNNSLIKKSKIEFLKANEELNENILKINSTLNYLNKALQKINNSIKLAKEEIIIQEEILKSAKKAFLLNRMSINDYLKEEDNLAIKRANLEKLLAQKNALISKKAYILGIDLKKVFK